MNQAEETAARCMRVARKVPKASRVTAFTLMSEDGVDLPPFTAGAHVELTLPNGLRRKYSLVGDPAEVRYWRLGVQDNSAESGGSSYLCGKVHEGDLLLASAAHNNFQLYEDAYDTVLIAGGIGITPFISMMHRLNTIGRRWHLHWACRSRSQAAFMDEVQQLAVCGDGLVHFHFDEEWGGAPMRIDEIIFSYGGESTHFYCCGPSPMLSAFRHETAGLDKEKVHFESFSAAQIQQQALTSQSYTVTLARSELSFKVPVGVPPLDAILNAGIDAPYSCREGFCGNCVTSVLTGTPIHKDLLLTEEERRSAMLICCSTASADAQLVLDL